MHLEACTKGGRKDIVMELETIVSTDRAQFGFQEAVQIEQVALRVAALMHTACMH